MKMLICGLVLGLALGGALGSMWFSTPSLSPVVTLTGRDAQGPSVLRAPREELRAAETDAPETAANRLPAEPTPAVTSRRRLAAPAPAVVESSQRARGIGQITGVVLNAAGEGLEGVQVRAVARESQSSSVRDPAEVGAAPRSPSPEHWVERALDGLQSQRSRTVETLSDDTGAFALTELSPASYEVRLERADYMFTSISHGSRSVRARPGEQLEFLARRILNLPVSVRYAGGTEARGAVVRCSVEPILGQQDWNRDLFGADQSEFSWSPGRPNLRVPAGRLHLRAYAGEEGEPAPAESALADLRSESLEVLVGEEGLTDPVVLELVRCSGIRGRLANPGPRQGASFPRVLLLALAPGEEVDLTHLQESEQSVYLPHAEEFGFVGLSPGCYAVGAQREWGSAIVVHRVVEVSSGITSCDLELPPLPEEEVLRVTVLDGRGRPMRLVSFSFTHHSAGSSSSLRGGGYPRDAKGAYLFPIPQASRTAYFQTPSEDDVFLLTLERLGCGTATAVLVPGQLSLTITLEAQAKGDIRALGFVGSGLEGRLSVELLPEAGISHVLDLYRNEPGELGADGSVRFRDYAPGLHEVRLLCSVRAQEQGRWMPARTLARRQVQLHSGENQITLPIPALHTLDVLVEDVPAGTEVLLWEGLGADGRSPVARTVTGESGQARFEDCRAGEYSVGIDGGERRRVTLPCGTLVLHSDG